LLSGRPMSGLCFTTFLLLNAMEKIANPAKEAIELIHLRQRGFVNFSPKAEFLKQSQIGGGNA